MGGSDTAVRVFVDDAVQGRFPRVCARTGGESDGWLTIDAIVGRSTSISTVPMILLLLFGGPIGWAVLLLFNTGHPGERLEVTVPWTVDVQAEIVELRRRRRLAWMTAAAGVAVLVGAMVDSVGASSPSLTLRVVMAALVVTTVAAGAVALTGQWRIRQQTVGVALDASHRWVTLTNVHPAFARAVRREQQGRPQPTT